MRRVVWIVQSKQGEDDYGNEGDPVLWAVCTSEAKACELARGLWGNTTQEIPEGVTVERVPTDVLLP